MFRPPRALQPSRPHHRGHRDREDGHAAVLAERLSAIGVPVFMADVKGGPCGLEPARRDVGQVRRAPEDADVPAPAFAGCPNRVLDMFGNRAPVRATVSDLGPLLLARILGLNDTQEGVLTLAFKIADDCGRFCSTEGPACAAAARR